MHVKHRLIALLVLTPLFASTYAAAQPPATAKPLPVVTVEANYAGANASVVADTVAAPIEVQVDGVEGMVHLRSRSSADGRYRLTVTFREGVDVDNAQVLVQNRVALAMPILPEAVKRSGVTVRKSAEALLYVAVSSSDRAHDMPFLGKYVADHVVDEIGRVPGVADLRTIGQRDRTMRIRLDPEKLAAHALAAADVIEAIKQQNIDVPGKLGQPPAAKDETPAIEIQALGRLRTVEEFGDVILKTDKLAGNVVRLRDVAALSLEATASRDQAFLNGKEIVVLVVHPLSGARPDEVSLAVQKKLALLRQRAPRGLKIDAAIDFAPGQASAPEFWKVDVDLPTTAATERTVAMLDRCRALLREIDGVQDVLALTDQDATSRGELLVNLTAGAGAKDAARAGRMKAMRERLADRVPGAVIRICGRSDSAAGPPAYPIDFAVCDKGDMGLVALRKQTDSLAERLVKTGKLTDVWADTSSAPRSCLNIDIDRDKVRTQGVAIDDVFSTLQVFLGSSTVSDFNRFGRTWQLVVPGKDKIDEIKQLAVRNKEGQMVRLSTIVSVLETSAPASIDRCDGEPMIAVTANPAAGVSVAEARALCEKLAAESLPAGYRLKRLR